MKLLKTSKDFMLYFENNNHRLNNIRQTTQTKRILKELYHDIFDAYMYLSNIKKRGKYFTVHVKNISNENYITRPAIFGINSFPPQILKHINDHAVSELSYEFSMYGRNVKLIFTSEEQLVQSKIKMFNKYVDTIILWLHILHKYASNNCSKKLIVYFYFTSLKKMLPSSKIYTIDQIHVNTGFTTTCPKDAEIVIFRKEEWFKVLIHETFHNFGLDFSGMDNSESTRCILDIFKVNSEVNLFESYTEFWAEIMNVLFCSFFSLKDKSNFEEFLSYTEFYMNFERLYSFFQLVKTLDFMGLSYHELFLNDPSNKSKLLYKEKTNVLAYYILTTILINNYQGFLFWCKKYNSSLLQFKTNNNNVRHFCRFIHDNYKTPSMIKGVSHAETFLLHMKQKHKSMHSNYMLSNLRMSICELG
jgi:hypothetical protein